MPARTTVGLGHPVGSGTVATHPLARDLVVTRGVARLRCTLWASRGGLRLLVTIYTADNEIRQFAHCKLVEETFIRKYPG